MRPFASFRFYIFLFTISFLIPINSVCTAQNPIEVLYALQNSSILTYDIDPDTLQATQVGEPLAVADNPVWTQLFPSPSGNFLYVITGSAPGAKSLYVYPTNSNGVPQASAVQTVTSSEIIASLAFHPNGRFAYLVEYTSTGVPTYDVRLLMVNPVTGKLTESPQALIQFPPSDVCGAGLFGFSPQGTQLDYSYSCNPENTTTATFYGAHIDPQTGELGPSQILLGYDDYVFPSADEVFFGNRTINDLHYQLPESSVLIYNYSNNGTPLIDCGADMSLACSQAASLAQDSSGQFLLLDLPTYNIWQMFKIDFAENRLVETGSSLSIFDLPYFSPDDRIMYALNQEDITESVVQVYGFNQSNGALTPGGSVTIPATLWNIYAAQRN